MGAEQGIAIEVQELTRRFGSVTALDRVSLSIRTGEFFSLLGPSGCGKTTLLRILAGLESADSGQVRLEGRDVRHLPAHRRPVNTVFQSYALFPHLNVRDNVAFGLRMKRVASTEITERVARVAELVEIASLVDRKPDELSGGQRQRVALARAIVNEPRVLLLDEPLAALDLKLRKQLQTELRNLQRRLGITFVYVTHDQDEALALSDRLAVMRDGRVEQLGDAPTLYQRPRTRFVSQFLGTCTLLEARVVRVDGARSDAGAEAVVETAVGRVSVESVPTDRTQLTLAIRPERIQLLPPTEPLGPNRFAARIERRTYVGAETQYEVVAGATRLRVVALNRDGVGETAFAAGTEALVEVPPAALIVLED